MDVFAGALLARIPEGTDLPASFKTRVAAFSCSQEFDDWRHSGAVACLKIGPSLSDMTEKCERAAPLGTVLDAPGIYGRDAATPAQTGTLPYSTRIDLPFTRLISEKYFQRMDKISATIPQVFDLKENFTFPARVGAIVLSTNC